ncbi:MAG: ABC transporter substrate-binding protein [Burkholderiaceae bacterium]|jgi:phospholipid transport system substrate-binding protein|nr:ABC transporter substrate-binding protein [Burkholderiaceae bacterium]
MKRRNLLETAIAIGGLIALALPAHATDEAPDALVRRLSSEMLEAIRADRAVRAGDINRTMALVDARIMPSVNFQRMTASAVGPGWRRATPEQQKRLQDEFKTLLVRTYAGALAQVTDQSVFIKPFRASQDDPEVLVRTEVRGKGEPIQLDYRLEKTPGRGSGWLIYDLNVLGVWLVENYRGQFAREVNARGVDGLLQALAEKNRVNASGKN